MKHLILITALLTACGSDPKDSGTNLVPAETEKTTTTEPIPEPTPTVEETPVPEPDPHGDPDSGKVVTSSQFKKFALAEADCTPERCIVKIKVEQACNATTYTRIGLLPYQLKDGYLYRTSTAIDIPPDWKNGNVVTIKLDPVPNAEPSDYASQGYQDQSGVMYNCPN